ncbi:MAG: substrate-binding domain-containing protein [Clostridiales bacterium]|jgi:ABC-type sugar transport system substrate-binding protein|nr:substrate-binding domain-containing protein [Bacillota bacterium]NLL53526.1 substrate-binding domain-containing protein [Clostridiales bacterium]
MRWWWLVPVALVLAFAVAFGAMMLGDADGTPSQELSGQKYLIGMSQANLVEPWRVTMNLEFAAAAEQHDKLRVIYTDAAQNTQQQIADVEMLMGYGIDLLVISPNDSEALRPIIAKVHQSIPVIVLDRAVRGEDYTLFIGPNNDMIGYMAGCRVVEMLGGRPGRVLELLGTQGSPPVAQRSAGFARALREHPEILLEKQLVANWQQDEAEDRFKEYLVSVQAPAEVVFAQNDAMAYGAWIAASALRVEGVRFVGVDGLRGAGGGVELVEQGIMEATYYCPTGGDQAVEYILRILAGDMPKDRHLILDPEEILPEAGEKKREWEDRTGT